MTKHQPIRHTPEAATVGAPFMAPDVDGRDKSRPYGGVLKRCGFAMTVLRRIHSAGAL